MTLPTSSAELAARFTRRLHVALDKHGMSYRPLPRARMLAASLDVDISLSSTMLNGLALPPWDIFLRLCDFLERQPGYFLDESDEPIPANACLVRPLEGGDTIVLSLPQSKSGRDVPTPSTCHYLVAHEAMGFGIWKDSYVVCFASPDSGKPFSLRQSQLYLLGSNGEYEVRQCFDLRKTEAVLTGLRNNAQLPMVSVPMDPHHNVHGSELLKLGYDFIGEIVACVQDLRTVRTVPIAVP